jgi:glycosyltransferase involved in cell wall biosynthesis
MRVHILTRDGSPLGCSLSTLIGTEPGFAGVGGAECALLTMCELWSKTQEVVLFNDPRDKYGSPFEQRMISSFDPNEKCDVLIVFRSTNDKVINAKADLKLWWSCDQWATGNFAEFRKYVDKVVLISTTHDNYFKTNYGITDGIVIDLPVRVWEYENKNIEKVRNSFIFTSVPARGLDTMLEIWPQIKKEIPDAILTITSDYRLWNCGRGNEAFMSKAFGLDGINYLSAIPRPRLVEEQLKAELNVFTCNYMELFCVACAESQVAGAYPITSNYGALITTNMGTVIPGDPNRVKDEYLRQSVAMLDNIHSVGLVVRELQYRAKERFSPDRILAEWDRLVFNK